MRRHRGTAKARFSYFCLIRYRASNNLTRIHQPMRVERVLDAAHQLQFQRALVVMEILALELTQAMFGADAAIESRDNLVHKAIHFMLMLSNECRVLRGIRHGRVVVNIAVADVAKGDAAYAGEGAMQRGIGLRDEFRDAADRHRDVVFDADTVDSLCLTDAVAQFPPFFGTRLFGRHRKYLDA